MFAFKAAIAGIALVSKRAKAAAERCSLRILNNLFSAPTSVRSITSIEEYDRAQDPSDFFTVCKKIGITADWFRGKTLLDAGCGTGGLTRAISELGAAAVTGIDIDPNQIEFARTISIKAHNASFQSASIYDIPFPNDSFDGAYSYTVFEHLEKPSEALREIRRVLKPGGRLIVAFNAFRSRYGAHLGPFVHIPWPAVFFSKEVLVEFWQSQHEAFCKTKTVKPDIYLRPQTFLELNRFTIPELETLIASADLEVVARSDYSGEDLPLRLLPGLRQCPTLFEYLRGSCVFLLRKPCVNEAPSKPPARP